MVFPRVTRFSLPLALHQVLLDRIATAADGVCRGSGSPQSVVVAGAGQFLAREVAQRVLVPGGTIIELDQAWGTEASNAACAMRWRCWPWNGKARSRPKTRHERAYS